MEREEVLRYCCCCCCYDVGCTCESKHYCSCWRLFIALSTNAPQLLLF
jgi:hypothetical protein